MKENTVVSFARRKPDAQLLATLSGRTDDGFISQPQQAQPSDFSVQKQGRCLPQKRGFYSSFDNTTENVIPQITTMPSDATFRTRPSDSKFCFLYRHTGTGFVTAQFFVNEVQTTYILTLTSCINFEFFLQMSVE